MKQKILNLLIKEWNLRKVGFINVFLEIGKNCVSSVGTGINHSKVSNATEGWIFSKRSKK